MSETDPYELFCNFITQIESDATKDERFKIRSYFELFNLILEETTQQDGIHFTTLFSRLAFAGSRFGIHKKLLLYAHIFRKQCEKNIFDKQAENKVLELARYVNSNLISTLLNKPAPFPFHLSDETRLFFTPDKISVVSFRNIIEALIFEIDTEIKTISFYDEEDPVNEKIARYDIADKNELFTGNIEGIKKHMKLPIHANFIDTELRDDGSYVPKGIIIHPDYLIDVTAIAECFKDFRTDPFLYLLSKFKKQEVSKALVIGNIVNFVLDELISDPENSFEQILKKSFKTNPLGLTVFSDQEVRDIANQIQIHFLNLKKTIDTDFNLLDIQRENIFLEPSFFSRDYGIQGRLDLLHQNSKTGSYDIIELKSGAAFKANVYGISASHYVQTLLYDLMIKSAFSTKITPSNYILYSKEKEKSLRFAPPVKAQQFEAMKVRNQIIFIEQKLKTVKYDNSILTYIQPENFPGIKGFIAKDIENFYNIYSNLSLFEKLYFDHFVSFIANEQALSKTGEHGVNKSNGHAALWLEQKSEKTDRFAMISGLTIKINHSFEKDPIIIFNRTNNLNKLSGFRNGDIGVLYPDTDEPKAILRNQVFKCTILRIDENELEVKLRSSQNNQYLFENSKEWILEEDILDSGYQTMYKSLFNFAASDIACRNLILGLKKPQKHRELNVKISEPELTSEQHKLLTEIIRSQDYYLLWGPPGTGKTSIMLKHLVAYLFKNTTENILLLSYTNRAVDEICAAICHINEDFNEEFIRIGSRHSTGETYRDKLLDQVMSAMSSRHEIREFLKSKRIVVSTVSSIINRTELFMLKEFDTVIIDEASQILEPMLIGLLPMFKRFILVGDHKQLPAVVRQSTRDSIIQNETLNEKGFFNTRISLFERLYLQCIKNNWTENLGILSQQGRMHKTLMHFPNTVFYEGRLKTLPGLNRLSNIRNWQSSNPLEKVLTENRLIYIPTEKDKDFNWKTNIHEAKIVKKIIESFLNLYQLNNIPFSDESIGIITPYRAQIARINLELEKLKVKYKSKITVDTVERYQGGARDIIIISLCTNQLSQLDSLVSLSQEGIDRKLNVAITRAKEQIIILGNQEILKTNTIYNELINSSYVLDLSEEGF